jgi:K+-transporting ATPase ATPase C chain
MLVLTVLLGLGYPVAMTALSQALMPAQANGSLILQGETVVGSGLIAQKFSKPQYFWPRPSAVDFNPQPSGGSNLSPASAALKTAMGERGSVPQDLLFTSASGLDPDISPAAAAYQVERVAQARGLAPAAVQEIVRLYNSLSQVGFLGEPRVHVLPLNLALDHFAEAKAQ